jgi:hypothetical protein
MNRLPLPGPLTGIVLLAGVFVANAAPARAVEKKAIDRAIDNGAASLRKMQQADGTWKHGRIGATALAGLTLLECGAGKEDKAVQAAALRVRAASLKMTDTYSLSLSVLFLDRLDNPADTPLVESMLVRLLAGQTANGGWTYECPAITAQEARRIAAEAKGVRGLKAVRDLSKLPAKGKRKTSDLPREIQAQLLQIARGAVAGVGGLAGIAAELGGDNSNTQFAVLALWVGRRYGVPTQAALLRVDQRFRAQQYPGGGWSYMVLPEGVAALAAGLKMPEGTVGPTATMTCAGLLGLAAGNGVALRIKKAKNPKVKGFDLSRDVRVTLGLQALATAVGKPTGWSGSGKPAAAVPRVSGKGYYFLWSLQRVCLAYGLETLGRNDWYTWGAEALLVSQEADGSWQGEYGACGADTCFALLFLKRVNLVPDLSTLLSGGKGLDDRVVKAGQGALLKGVAKALEPVGVGDKPADSGTTGETKPSTPQEKEVARLADELVEAKGEKRAALLKQMVEGKGPGYTEALAGAIGRLEVAGRRKAREALAERLAKGETASLRECLADDDGEIRRAAAVAAAKKEAKGLAPELIRLLGDSERAVRKAAHSALKELSGKDFGPRGGAGARERAEAVAAWQTWWKKQSRE